MQRSYFFCTKLYRLKEFFIILYSSLSKISAHEDWLSFDEKWNAEKEKVEKLGINQWEQMVLIAVQHCTLHYAAIPM